MTKFKFGLAAACLALLTGLAFVAHAQVNGIPSANIASPTGLEQVTVANTGPYLQTVQTRQVRDAAGYAVSTASSGTVTFASGQSELILTAGTTISTLTIALTAAPADGQINCFYNKSAISTLTLSGAQTINDGLTSTSATTRYCYLYSSQLAAWNRMQ